MTQRTFGYTRIVSILALIPSAVWFAAVALPYFPDYLQEPADLSFVLPYLYWLTMTSLAIATMVRPPKHFIKHAIRGALVGAILAYACIFTLYLSQPAHWGDGLFEWAMLFVGLLYGGVFFSLVGAIMHCAYAAIRVRTPRSSNLD